MVLNRYDNLLDISALKLPQLLTDRSMYNLLSLLSVDRVEKKSFVMN